jgi:Protein of unknown function (DUF3037)
MSDRTNYTFTVLRYVHDITTGEFVNVGVVLHAPKAKFLRARMRSTYGRISRFFPGAHGENIKRVITQIETAVLQAAERLDDLFPEAGDTAVDFASRILPHDDSSLQWSKLGSGQTRDPGRELDILFDRMVLRHERLQSVERRTDEEVWREFSKSLQKRHVLSHFREKEIIADADSKTFSRAWKNGVWHCLEPVSFDLIDGNSIHEKAHRYLGQFTALRDAEEQFKVYLLIGEPRHNDVQSHYLRAMRILEKIPVPSEIFTETQMEDFASRIANEVRGHEAHPDSH